MFVLPFSATVKHYLFAFACTFLRGRSNLFFRSNNNNNNNNNTFYYVNNYMFKATCVSFE